MLSHVLQLNCLTTISLPIYPHTHTHNIKTVQKISKPCGLFLAPHLKRKKLFFERLTACGMVYIIYVPDMCSWKIYIDTFKLEFLSKYFVYYKKMYLIYGNYNKEAVLLNSNKTVLLLLVYWLLSLLAI